MKKSIIGTFRFMDTEKFTRLSCLVLIMALLVIVGGCGGDKDEAIPAVDQSAMVPSGSVDPAVKADTLSQGMGYNEAQGGNSGLAGEVETSTQDPSTALEAQAVVPPSTESSRANEAGVSGRNATQDLTSLQEGGIYSLQLGSFQRQAFAEKRAEDVQNAGFDPVVEEVDLAGQIYYRVLVRGISDREMAQELGQDLGAQLGITYLIKRAD